MKQQQYFKLITKFIETYNKKHKEEILLKCVDGCYEIVTTNETLAVASNLEDLAIMLFLTRDTRQDKNEFYWMENNNWGYNPKFLNEIMKKGGKRNV